VAMGVEWGEGDRLRTRSKDDLDVARHIVAPVDGRGEAVAVAYGKGAGQRRQPAIERVENISGLCAGRIGTGLKAHFQGYELVAWDAGQRECDGALLGCRACGARRIDSEVCCDERGCETRP